jgi:hypothetical protein
MNLIHYWHNKLNMPKYDEEWHKQDMVDELAEYTEAHGLIDTWSELSDVAYTYTRAKWSGHTTVDFPLSKIQLFVGILYMFPKYTLRWRFFRELGHQFDKGLNISEVRNPKKISKLVVIAEKYHLDPSMFQERAEKLLKSRFLLK